MDQIPVPGQAKGLASLLPDKNTLPAVAAGGAHQLFAGLEEKIAGILAGAGINEMDPRGEIPATERLKLLEQMKEQAANRVRMFMDKMRQGNEKAFKTGGHAALLGTRPVELPTQNVLNR
jgi:hypothetical protein